MKHKLALAVALLSVIIIISRIYFLLGAIGSIGVALWIIVTFGLLCYYIFSCLEKGSWAQSILFGLLGLATLASIIYASYEAPRMSANEVFTMHNLGFRNRGILIDAVQYKGSGIWDIKIISSSGVGRFDFNENK